MLQGAYHRGRPRFWQGSHLASNVVHAQQSFNAMFTSCNSFSRSKARCAAACYTLRSLLHIRAHASDCVCTMKRRGAGIVTLRCSGGPKLSSPHGLAVIPSRCRRGVVLNGPCLHYHIFVWQGSASAADRTSSEARPCPSARRIPSSNDRFEQRVLAVVRA